MGGARMLPPQLADPIPNMAPRATRVQFPYFKPIHDVTFALVRQCWTVGLLIHSLSKPGSEVSKCEAEAPSIAFRHLPPNSARFSYATEGALFISAQLSTDAVGALRKVRVLI